MRKLLATLGLTALLATTAAYAHGDETGGTEIHIQSGEMFFQVEGQEKGELLRLQAGEHYTLVFENLGQIKHEILIGRGEAVEDGRRDGYQEQFLDAVEVAIEGHAENGGEFEVEAPGLKEIYLDPGVVLELSFRVPEDRRGEWEIGCFIPGHYPSGMFLPVRVE